MFPFICKYKVSFYSEQKNILFYKYRFCCKDKHMPHHGKKIQNYFMKITKFLIKIIKARGE